MLSTSQTDFKYDEQTPCSNPPEGDASSGGAGRFLGRGGGHSSSNNGPSRNDNERWNNTSTRARNHLDTRPHLSRDDLRHFAYITLRTLDDGEYFPPGAVEPYDLKLKINWMCDNTRYYGPDAGKDGEMLESEFVRVNKGGDGGGKEEDKGEGNQEEDKIASSLAGQGEETVATTASEAENKQIDNNSKLKAQALISPDSTDPAIPDTPIYIGEYSTLVAARKIHLLLASNSDPSTNQKIGVLNFASAKKPGGGFINGSQAQEESIARASTLYRSLLTTAASQFYTHYQEEPSNAYYTHAMVYSPGVLLLRDDNGEWRRPVEVDVLTSAAVNAGEIRRGIEREEKERRERKEWELWKRREGERRREREKAMAEKSMKREQEFLKRRERERLKEKEVAKQQKKSEDKETEQGNEKDMKEQTSVDQENADVEAEKKNEAEKLEKEKATDTPESGSEMKNVKETTESEVAAIQDDQPQPEALPEVNQEPSSSAPLSPQTEPDPDISFSLALSNAEYQIQYTMYARISRVLHLFQLHQATHLVLGSFGTGVFQNRIDVVAAIFADFLVKPSGRFKNVFTTVVFAILGKETVRVFEEVFSRTEKQARRERGDTGKTFVFLDDDRSDGDVRERKEEKMARMMRWKARRIVLADAAAAQADTASAASAGPAAAYDHRIAEDEKMVLTDDNEKVESAVKETTVEMVEIKSLSASYREAHNSKPKEKDIEMQ